MVVILWPQFDRYLALKLCFLFALVSTKKVGELCGLSHDVQHYRSVVLNLGVMTLRGVVWVFYEGHKGFERNC